MGIPKNVINSDLASLAVDYISQSSGADLLTVSKSIEIEALDFFNGRDGLDTILIGGNDGATVDLSAAGTSETTGFHHYESLSFGNNLGTSIAKLDAAQFGMGLIANDLFVSGDEGAQQIVILNATNFSARNWTFERWISGEDSIIIHGSSGNDKLIASGEGGTIDGHKGNDTIIGSAVADNLIGGGGNDVIVGGLGRDILDGGNGNDTLSYASSSTRVAVNLAAGTFWFGAAAGDEVSNFESIIGSSFDDALTGDAGANSLSGGNGNDDISGGAGRDFINGGRGIDTLTYADSTEGVVVNLLSNDNHQGDAAGDKISGVENLIGSELDDILTGSSNKNSIAAHGGNDTVVGGGGHDILDGGDGTDTLSYAGSGSGVKVDLSTDGVQGGDANGDVISRFENVIGSAFDDNLTGDRSVSILTGGAGDDKLLGLAGDDILIGGKGDDVIVGGEGNDTLSGGDGSDTVFYSGNRPVYVNLVENIAIVGDHYNTDTISGFENIHGGVSFDKLTGDDNANIIDGGGGNDDIWGGGGNDVILGGWGKEEIWAGDGDDRITGGAEDDSMWGGQGDDSFVYEGINDSGIESGSVDVIMDFGVGKDHIDFSALDASLLKVGDQSFVFIGGAAFSAEGQIRVTQYQSYAIVDINVSGHDGTDMRIALHGVSVAELTASDFIL